MKVYHCKYLWTGYLTGDPAPAWPQDYELVAEVDQADLRDERALSEAFQLTNAVDQPWTKNPGVTPHCPDRQRSTSPGDAVALDDGTLWLCGSNGWQFMRKLWEAKIVGGTECKREIGG